MAGWEPTDREKRWRRHRQRASHREVGEALREEGERLAADLESWALHKVRGARRRLGPAPDEEEARAWKEARAAASRRVGFYGHLVPYLATCAFLLFVAGFRVALIVGLSWGIGVACHGFYAILAPELRRRWTDAEVGRRVPVEVSRNRRELEGQHARHLEHLSASIAHEIRNPITAAKSLLQQMGEDPHSAENVEYAAVALQELERVERSISHLLRYARDEALRPERVVLREVVRSGLDTLRERIDDASVAVRVDADEAGAVVADPEQLRRVVINLVANALDAVGEQRTPPPRIDVEAGANLAGTEVWLRVRDNGPGIPPERLAEIWSPFRTTKANGTGLGLPMVRKIVEAHGGSVEADSSPGRGTEFLVTLPRESSGGPTQEASR